ncbi:hypothetical protein OG21DRAFT_1528309 [Imleria badia]|nr:hypothetical protein OG21DRAFT_1528309 [Imleria badia]
MPKIGQQIPGTRRITSLMVLVTLFAATRMVATWHSAAGGLPIVAGRPSRRIPKGHVSTSGGSSLNSPHQSALPHLKIVGKCSPKQREDITIPILPLPPPCGIPVDAPPRSCCRMSLPTTKTTQVTRVVLRAITASSASPRSTCAAAHPGMQ